MAAKLLALDYEVFGKVQGVFFRKYTEKQAKALGLRGWIINTREKTVKGQLEGDNESISRMKEWLRKEGSPSSRIERAVFKNEKEISAYTMENFSIRK